MSGFSRVSISDSLRRTIEDIKEITGQHRHSDEDIYEMLKDCNMDPNETAQKLLYLGSYLPLHISVSPLFQSKDVCMSHLLLIQLKFLFERGKLIKVVFLLRFLKNFLLPQFGTEMLSFLIASLKSCDFLKVIQMDARMIFIISLLFCILQILFTRLRGNVTGGKWYVSSLGMFLSVNGILDRKCQELRA